MRSTDVDVVRKPGFGLDNTMHERAGTSATSQDLIDLQAVLDAYHDLKPDPQQQAQRVSFGTSGHRGASLDRSFNDCHIAAITQAVCDYRAQAGITGPLFLARDTHALSEPAFDTTLEVLGANDVHVIVDDGSPYTPTPALSHAVLHHNRPAAPSTADGIVITPSHNPPRDGGYKYNAANGGPADQDATSWIAQRANDYLRNALIGVQRKTAPDHHLSTHTVMDHYVRDLANVIDLQAIKDRAITIGADPLGGASVDYWSHIARVHELNITVVNDRVDPRWSFMPLDHDGKIRMDCSSPHAMANLVSGRHAFDLCTGNDADADRHGIVTPDAGLMNPNHFLAVSIDYLLTHRPQWPTQPGIGKTLVSSMMIDRVVQARGARLVEVPVGFKWFVPGLLDGSLVFAGEESAGASLVRTDGSTWTTDKDGLVMCLLAAEILAVTGKTPSQYYQDLVAEHGAPCYSRTDAPASTEQRQTLAALDVHDVRADTVAGEAITAVLTRAPGNDAPIGGLKVCTENAWFAARPSGTEPIYKIYAESFLGEDHLIEVRNDAQALVSAALDSR